MIVRCPHSLCNMFTTFIASTILVWLIFFNDLGYDKKKQIDFVYLCFYVLLECGVKIFNCVQDASINSDCLSFYYT